jgi:hypothetical protein
VEVQGSGLAKDGAKEMLEWREKMRMLVKRQVVIVTSLTATHAHTHAHADEHRKARVALGFVRRRVCALWKR